MENIIVETTAPTDLIPSFADLKTPPKSAGEGLWLIAMLGIPVVLWSLKELASIRISAIKAETENKIAEDKQELAQRDGLIKHLQEQNNMLINEIMILRRTMDYSGDFAVNQQNKRG